MVVTKQRRGAGCIEKDNQKILLRSWRSRYNFASAPLHQNLLELTGVRELTCMPEKIVTSSNEAKVQRGVYREGQSFRNSALSHHYIATSLHR